MRNLIIANSCIGILCAHGGTAYAAMSAPAFSLDVNGDDLVDTADLEMYTDLWQQQTQPPPARPPGRLR